MTRWFLVKAHRFAPLLVLPLLLLLAPLAEAQAGPVSLTADVAPELPPVGPILVPVNVTLDCTLIASKAGTVNVDVGLAEAPAWLNATTERLTFSVTECASNTSTTLLKSGTVSLEPAMDAPGLEPFAITLQAQVVGSTEKASTRKENIILAYRPGHVLTPAGDQTIDVTEETYAFELRIDVTSNAQTMVMFEDKTVDVGSLDGLRAMTFDVANGDRSITYNVLFTPPETAWTEANVRFRTYSHCLVGSGCDPQLEQNITRTFLNKQPAKPLIEPSPDSPTPTGGESPNIGAMLTLALVSLAGIFLRRRNSREQ